MHLSLYDESNDGLTQTLRDTVTVNEVVEEEVDEVYQNKVEEQEKEQLARQKAILPLLSVKGTVSDVDAPKKVNEEHNNQEPDQGKQELLHQKSILLLASEKMTVTYDDLDKQAGEVHEKEEEEQRNLELAQATVIHPTAFNPTINTDDINRQEIHASDSGDPRNLHFTEPEDNVEKAEDTIPECAVEISVTKTVSASMQITDINAPIVKEQVNRRAVKEAAINSKKAETATKLKELYSEDVNKVQSDPGELAIVRGFGGFSLANLAFRISSTNGGTTRQSETNPIILTNSSTSMRDVLVFPYPATKGTTGTLVSRKEIFPIPGYVPNNLAFVNHNGNFLLGIITNLFAWKCVLNSENELRASVTVLHGDNGLIMDTINAGSPYKFEQRNINVWHKNGDIIMVKLDGSYFLAVVKTDFLDMDPLSMVVTLLISLKKNSDNLITVVCEDRNILRWGVFMKTVRFLSLLGFYFIFFKTFFS